MLGKEKRSWAKLLFTLIIKVILSVCQYNSEKASQCSLVIFFDRSRHVETVALMTKCGRDKAAGYLQADHLYFI